MKKLSFLFVPLFVVVFFVSSCGKQESTPIWVATPETDVTLKMGESQSYSCNVSQERNSTFSLDEILKSIKIWYYYKDVNDNTLPNVDHPGVIIVDEALSNLSSYTTTINVTIPDTLPQGTTHIIINFSAINSTSGAEGTLKRKIIIGQ